MSKQRALHLIVPIAAALVLAGSAFAYLRASGSGSGSGNVNVTLSSVTIAASTGTTQSLLPTGTATGDVSATITNPNSSRVHVPSLSLDTTQGTAGFSAGAAGCALSFSQQTAGWTIPANSSITVDLTNALTMGTAAASSCQGKTFTVYLTTP